RGMAGRGPVARRTSRRRTGMEDDRLPYPARRRSRDHEPGSGAGDHSDRDTTVRQTATHLVPASIAGGAHDADQSGQSRRRHDHRGLVGVAAAAMKIGITCYPTYGGSGAVATELGVSLAKLGHEVHFISYAQPFRLPLFTPRVYFHEVDVGKYPLFEYPPYDLALAVRMHE